PSGPPGRAAPGLARGCGLAATLAAAATEPRPAGPSVPGPRHTRSATRTLAAAGPRRSDRPSALPPPVPAQRRLALAGAARRQWEGRAKRRGPGGLLPGTAAAGVLTRPGTGAWPRPRASAAAAG